MEQRAEASNSMTVEDYLALEEASSVKHEYVGGEVYDLAGALVLPISVAGADDGQTLGAVPPRVRPQTITSSGK